MKKKSTCYQEEDLSSSPDIKRDNSSVYIHFKKILKKNLDENACPICYEMMMEPF